MLLSDSSWTHNAQALRHQNAGQIHGIGSFLNNFELYSRSRNILILWKSKIHYRVHESLPIDTVLNKLKLIHNFIPYFCMINFNIIIPSMPMSQIFRPKCNIYFTHVCYMSLPSHPSWFNRLSNIMQRVQSVKLPSLIP